MHQCNKCKIIQPLVNFCKDNKSKSGYSYRCKTCAANYLKKYNAENRERIKITQEQYRSKNKAKISEIDILYRKKNKQKANKYNKEYYKKNKVRLLEQQKEYNKVNKISRNKYIREYNLNKRRSNILFKLIGNLRHRVQLAFKAKKSNKRNSTKEILGLPIEQVKQYLENQFQPGMTWENHGSWHIDHIIPLSSAKTEEELYKLCHYTNLQPLWAKDNLSKGAKILYDQDKNP